MTIFFYLYIIYIMDSAFLFWEKYFNNQIEVSWDEFNEAFIKFI